MKILVTGAKGRMGQAVIRAVEAEPTTLLGAAIDVGDPLGDAIGDCDAVIDFTAHGFTTELVESCVSRSKSLIMGTTGHSQGELQVIADAAEHIPIVHAPNFSVGVNTLFWLARHATSILGSSFDLEVVEMHHRHKTDAPSGTARRLAEILAEASGVRYDEQARHGRVGDVGARTAREIGVHAVRGGDVVGDHTAIYAGSGERLELTHKASSRDTFAQGAVRAAVWLAGKPAGLYDMEDVLGLSEAK